MRRQAGRQGRTAVEDSQPSHPTHPALVPAGGFLAASLAADLPPGTVLGLVLLNSAGRIVPGWGPPPPGTPDAQARPPPLWVVDALSHALFSFLGEGSTACLSKCLGKVRFCAGAASCPAASVWEGRPLLMPVACPCGLPSATARSLLGGLCSPALRPWQGHPPQAPLGTPRGQRWAPGVHPPPPDPPTHPPPVAEGGVARQLARVYPVAPQRADAWLAREITRAAHDPGAQGVFRRVGGWVGGRRRGRWGGDGEPAGSWWARPRDPGALFGGEVGGPAHLHSTAQSDGEPHTSPCALPAGACSSCRPRAPSTTSWRPATEGPPSSCRRVAGPRGAMWRCHWHCSSCCCCRRHTKKRACTPLEGEGGGGPASHGCPLSRCPPWCHRCCRCRCRCRCRRGVRDSLDDPLNDVNDAVNYPLNDAGSQGPFE